MENREESSGLCEEIGGADVPWGGGTWGGDEPHGKLKCIEGGAGNIVNYVKNALNKQRGGECVILELPSHSRKYYYAITEARKKCKGRIFFYIAEEKILKEVIKIEASENRPRGGTRSLRPCP